MENRCQSRILFPNCQLKMETKTCRDPSDSQALFPGEPLKDMFQQNEKKTKSKNLQVETLPRKEGWQSRQTELDQGRREPPLVANRKIRWMKASIYC